MGARRFESNALTVRGGRLQTVALWAAIVLFAIPSALTCPFVWAFAAYQVLRAGARRRSAAHTLARASAGLVEIDGDRIVVLEQDRSIPARELPRQTLLTRGEVIDGWIEEGFDKTCVVARLRGGRRLYVATEGHAEARSLLRNLGIAVDQQVVRFPLASAAVRQGQGAVYHLLGPMLAALFSLSAFATVLGAALSGQPALVLFAAAMVTAVLLVLRGLVRSMRRPTVAIGVDGFTILEGSMERFVPFAEVHEIVRQQSAVGVHLADELLWLETRSFAGDEPELADALHRRLEEALALHRRAGALGAAGVALLERGDRDAAAWLADLRALSGERGSYRERFLEPAQLAEVLDNPSEPVERRAAAAVVMTGAGDRPDLRQRVRVAAQTCAHPRLRIVLEQSAAGEIEAAELEALLAYDERAARSGSS